MAWRVRRARPSDSESIARINVEGWQAAYRGLLPDAYLDAMTVDSRVEPWRERLSMLSPRTRCFVAEDDRGIAAYCLAGPYRRDEDAGTPDPGDCGEIYAIYAAPERWGTGAGLAVFLHALDDLRAGEYAAAVLWMLEGNARAARFYERCGWYRDGATKTEPFDDDGDVLATEVRYRYDFGAADSGPG